MIIVESIQKVSEEVIFTQCMLHSFSFCKCFPVVYFTCFESLVHAVSDGFTGSLLTNLKQSAAHFNQNNISFKDLRTC